MSTMPESAIVYAGFHQYDLIIIAGLKAPSAVWHRSLKLYENGDSCCFPDLKLVQLFTLPFTRFSYPTNCFFK
ncbi:hypothetical protein CS542_05725 [Pedobacter sp. IW39]|nr:hypothetical protein CS542_05725 [Pedobacter sp. IW39]